MIQADSLTKFYGPHLAIWDVSFQVKVGEVVAFLGPNGAGKSTTMRILTGYMPATSGHARVAGFDVAEQSLAARRNVGYMPEHIALYPDMRVNEYLTYCGKLEGMGAAQLKERMAFVIGKCALTERASAMIGTLSLGFRQRVGLAQSLLHDPPVLILDEPTIGLDPLQIVEFRGLLKELAGQHTILLSTHILSEAQLSCERVLIMNHGRIVAEGPPDRLTTQIRQAEAYVLRVARPAEAVRAQLQALAQVTAVKPLGHGAYEIETPVGSDPRTEITRTAVEQGWGLLEFRPVEMNLEDVFQELTKKGSAA